MSGGGVISLHDYRLLKAWNDPHRPFTAAEYVAFAKSAAPNHKEQTPVPAADRAASGPGSPPIHPKVDP